jgi:hypothetical protein
MMTHILQVGIYNCRVARMAFIAIFTTPAGRFEPANCETTDQHATHSATQGVNGVVKLPDAYVVMSFTKSVTKVVTCFRRKLVRVSVKNKMSLIYFYGNTENNESFLPSTKSL